MTEDNLTPDAFGDACRRITDNDRAPGERLEAARSLFDGLSRAAGLDGMKNAEKEMGLPNGVAISALDAARCLLEFLRTGRFIEGLRLAIAEAQKRFPGERIRVLDAGCGPFALLALSQTTWYAPEEVGFILLDCQADVLSAAERCVGALQGGDYVIDVVCADATRYVSPEGSEPHVLVTETMTHGLGREPQVAIASNLVKQLVPEGVMVPEAVTVELALLHPPTTENQPPPRWSKPVVRLDLESARHGLGRAKFEVPAPVNNERFFLTTRIDVFGPSRLEMNDCSLTLPVYLGGGERLRGGESVAFSYRSSGFPGIIWEGVGYCNPPGRMPEPEAENVGTL
ncbi:MAG: hypothetical protein R6X15_04685 [Pseudomonadota bacterium]